VAPSVNGLDLSSVSIDFTGSATIAGIGGRAPRRRGPHRRPGSVQQRAERPRATLHELLAHVRRLVELDQGTTRQVRRRNPAHPLYTDRLGATTYHLLQYQRPAEQHTGVSAVLGDISAPNPLHGGVTGNRFLKQNYYIFYAQDEWKIRPNVTMSYGVRYEYYSPCARPQPVHVLRHEHGRPGSEPNDSGIRAPGTTGASPGVYLVARQAQGQHRVSHRAGYYYGPGQMEDQVQLIDSDRVTVSRSSGVAFPVNSQEIINSFDLKNFKVSSRASTRRATESPRGSCPTRSRCSRSCRSTR